MEPPDSLAKAVEVLLLEAVGQLDSAADCLICAEAAVALQSRRAAVEITRRLGTIANEEFRFRSMPEFLVIRDLATAARLLRDGFPT